MRKVAVFFFCMIFVLGLVKVSNACFQVIDFEDLYPGYETGGLLPAGYAGFNWSSDAKWVTDQYIPGSGYDYGTIGKVSLYTAWESDINMNKEVFDFKGAYITAAWNTGQDVTVEGWLNGSPIYSNTIMTSYNGPYWFDFNYSGVDTVWFKPGDLGTNVGLGGGGHHIVIDNVTVTPIPSTCLLFLSGLIGMVGIKRKVWKA